MAQNKGAIVRYRAIDKCIMVPQIKTDLQMQKKYIEIL